jgi:hypothetical protein
MIVAGPIGDQDIEDLLTLFPALFGGAALPRSRGEHSTRN